MPAPANPSELAEALRCAASSGKTISLGGNGSKCGMAGPVETADVSINTRGLQGVIRYEPQDLTISVEAGLPWAKLTRLLAENRQIVPLDPPFSDDATVGGVIAANSSGPRRRLYGTARDLVIGMQFATLEGKLVQSGGMVVKNVAGLDMGKLMIGSFGTLAAIASVNFKLQPMPQVERSFLLPFASLNEAISARNLILRGQLQPSAIDLINPAAASTIGKRTWLLALRAGGNAASIDRYEREFAPLADGLAFEGERQETLWRHLENFTPSFLARHRDAVVVRASCTLKDCETIMGSFSGPALARAGNGVCYAYFENSESAAKWMKQATSLPCKAAVECASDYYRRTMELWPCAGADFEMMKRVKHLFDPKNLLNRGRLYRRI